MSPDVLQASGHPCTGAPPRFAENHVIRTMTQSGPPCTASIPLNSGRVSHRLPLLHGPGA